MNRPHTAHAARFLAAALVAAAGLVAPLLLAAPAASAAPTAVTAAGRLADVEDPYPGADWADPTGTVICGIHQIDPSSERSWKYAAQCQHSEKVRMTRAHRAMCKWNEWSGPIVGPMGGRWFCAHDPWAMPYVTVVGPPSDGDDGELGSMWWTKQVRPKIVRGVYTMPTGTTIDLGTITCLQGKNWVKCDDRRTKTGFTAYANGTTTWRGVKGKIRTYADVQY